MSPPDDIRRQGHWPLYRIDAEGVAQRIGELHALQDGYFRLTPNGERPAFTQGDLAEGLHPGMPWFLDDLRPQGFLGNAFNSGRTNADQSTLDFLLDFGEDLPGDLALGNESLDGALAIGRGPPDAVPVEERTARYPQLAAASMRGEKVGPTVGGAQPKFATTVKRGGGFEPVVVKFSDRMSKPAGRRWADLLLSEHLAGLTLCDHGIAAARTEVIETDDRVFLQSTRFDRTPALGRRGVLSLAALDAAFYGHGRIDWWRFATQLERDDWLTPGDARILSVLSWFGLLIANADMHLGNASLYLGDDRPLALAPSYDMLPMRFRPSVSGEIVERRYGITMPTPEQQAHWHEAAVIAVDFWQRVSRDDRTSARFRAIATDARRTVERARSHLPT